VCGVSGTHSFVGSIRRELLDRTLIINMRHCASVLREFERHYNDHRPHRSLAQAAPLRPLPHRTRTEIRKVRRHDRLGGLIHEYQHCRMMYAGFRAPTGEALDGTDADLVQLWPATPQLAIEARRARGPISEREQAASLRDVVHTLTVMPRTPRDAC
jgi:hypothetical protein